MVPESILLIFVKPIVSPVIELPINIQSHT